MEANNKFYRSFLIFSQEDTGFGNNGTPSGYVKIESREGKGKLHISVQNLKENKEGSNYKVYIVKCDEKQAYAVCAGAIPYQRNKGELHWDFNPANVSNSGIGIADFNVAAVIVENNNSANKNIICPLAAYKDKKVQWRDKMKELQNNVKIESEEDEGDIIKKHELYSKYEKKFESKYSKIDFTPNADLEGVEQYVEEAGAEDGNVNMVAENIPEKINEEEAFEEQGVKFQEESNNNMNIENNIDMPENDVKAEKEAIKYDELKVPGFSNGHVNIDELEIGNPPKIDPAINPGMCSYMNSSYCNPQMSGNIPYACVNCNIKNMKKEELPKEQVLGDRTATANMEKFRKNLDIYFELSDPFKSNRKDYKWWMVNSPVQLNNIFYQCYIRTPLFFNPSVIMSHYKYRYLIVGIYLDKIRNKEYIVCGIPGVYGIDDKPFGDMCRWVQVEGNKPRYGAFGYWLVYIDPKTGKFLGLN